MIKKMLIKNNFYITYQWKELILSTIKTVGCKPQGVGGFGGREERGRKREERGKRRE